MTSHDNEARPWAANSRRSRILVVCLMTAVFFFGAVVGAVVTGRYLWTKHIDALQRPRFQTPRMMRRMQQDFDLTGEQAKQLETVFADHHEKVMAIREEVRSGIETEIESLRRQVEAVLRPEQAKRWEERFDVQKQRWMPPSPGMHGRGPRHGMGRRAFLRGWPDLPENADTDKDGRITLEEWNVAFKGVAEDRFKNLDTNGDGSLSPEEIQPGGRMMRRRHRGWSME